MDGGGAVGGGSATGDGRPVMVAVELFLPPLALTVEDEDQRSSSFFFVLGLFPYKLK